MSDGAATAEISVDRLARYLAWSDRVMNATASSTRFENESARYWQYIEPKYRGRWLALAAALLGATDAHEVGARGRPKNESREEWRQRQIPSEWPTL